MGVKQPLDDITKLSLLIDLSDLFLFYKQECRKKVIFFFFKSSLLTRVFNFLFYGF